MTQPTVFQKYCEKAIGRLCEDDVIKFKSTTRDDERVKFMYDYARAIPINVCNDGKSMQEAQISRDRGNKAFAAKKFDEALAYYNTGIIKCPQNSGESQELLTILISNRSATYFDIQEYRKVFDDIDYVLAIGKYPQRLHYKMWLRKAKCYDALENQRYADETYTLAISSLKHAQLSEEGLSKKIHEIKESRKHVQVKPSTKGNEVIPVSNSDSFAGGNEEYVAAHKNIYFDYDHFLGRFARAAEDIDCGVIIIEENPHCAVVSSDNILSNCQYCCTSTSQPIACPKCGYVVFCSLNCERQANSSFHRTECGIQPILFESGASINCSMALRIISQKPLGFFTHKKKALKDYLKDNCKKVAIKPALFKSDDYTAIFFLCRNENLRKKGELVHYSSIAIYLLRLLKYANYFGNEYSDEVLTEDESFIACLLLRHLQILQFNSHEISELQNTKESPTITDGLQTYYKNEYIGAGLYPTLALFNHSCDPSLVRYNIGNRVIARTIKPIKAGDIIYENYGPIYTTVHADARRKLLQERYWFDCHCNPCQDEWPLFENMNENQIKLGCQTKRCPFEFVLYKDDFCPYFTCDYCNNVTKVFSSLKGLAQLESILPSAEAAYSLGQHRLAAKLFTDALNILFKYSKPPLPDMVKVQQRLRNLFVHLGNKHANYKASL